MKKLIRQFKERLFLYKIKHNPIKILWFPKIENYDDLIRELSRAVWYLNPIIKDIESITFEVEESLLRECYVFPDYVDQNIASMYEKIKDKYIFVSQPRKERFDVIVEWSFSNLSKKISSLIYIRSDVNYHQFDSTKLIKFVALFATKIQIENNNKRLQEVLTTFKEKEYSSVLLLGSGPSLDNLTNKVVRNTMPIICNSVVKNTLLLKLYNPKLVVATDTVFHTGYSLYASEFRKNLCSVLENYSDCFFMVPLRDLLLYKSNLPSKFSHRIIGIKGIQHKKFNLNILNKLFVKSTSNVLTFFLLPLASTINKKIYLIGFDGKKSDEKDMFWSYSKASQFTDIIENVKVAHPAFYKVDYGDYNKKHIYEVETIVKDLLQQKYQLLNLAASNISILNKLYQDVHSNE